MIANELKKEGERTSYCHANDIAFNFSAMSGVMSGIFRTFLRLLVVACCFNWFVSTLEQSCVSRIKYFEIT